MDACLHFLLQKTGHSDPVIFCTLWHHAAVLIAGSSYNVLCSCVSNIEKTLSQICHSQWLILTCVLLPIWFDRVPQDFSNLIIHFNVAQWAQVQLSLNCCLLVSPQSWNGSTSSIIESDGVVSPTRGGHCANSASRNSLKCMSLMTWKKTLGDSWTYKAKRALVKFVIARAAVCLVWPSLFCMRNASGSPTPLGFSQVNQVFVKAHALAMLVNVAGLVQGGIDNNCVNGRKRCWSLCNGLCSNQERHKCNQIRRHNELVY